MRAKRGGGWHGVVAVLFRLPRLLARPPSMLPPWVRCQGVQPPRNFSRCFGSRLTVCTGGPTTVAPLPLVERLAPGPSLLRELHRCARHGGGPALPGTEVEPPALAAPGAQPQGLQPGRWAGGEASLSEALPAMRRFQNAQKTSHAHAVTYRYSLGKRTHGPVLSHIAHLTDTCQHMVTSATPKPDCALGGHHRHPQR